MLEENVVLLLTACVTPPTQMIFTQITNSTEREQRYIYCLKWYIANSKYKKIVFCDNSNCSPFPGIFEYAEKHNKQLEFISFHGDNKMTQTYGKGYGDGEIINYAINNSKLIKESQYFIKISGRYVFDNIDTVFNYKKNRDFYYKVGLNKKNIFRKDERTTVDTVIFSSNVDCFKDFFGKAHLDINDQNGVFYENVFSKILIENKTKHWFTTSRMARLPNYCGNKSGTMGVDYKKKNPFVAVLRNILNKLGFYQV